MKMQPTLKCQALYKNEKKKYWEDFYYLVQTYCKATLI